MGLYYSILHTQFVKVLEKSASENVGIISTEWTDETL